MPRGKTVRPKKVRSIPDWAQAIRELYTALDCGTQEQFAAKVHSKQGTVSTWLRGDETRRPSADTLARFAGLAIKRDVGLASRLLRLANISEETISAVADKLNTDRQRKPRSGECVTIRRVEKTRDGLKDAGTPILMPVELVPNPAFTHCFGISFTAGQFDQWAIVDTKDAEEEGLGPFWGYPVLIEFAPNMRLRPLRPVTLEVGMLFLEEDQPNPNGIPWFARFLLPQAGRLHLSESVRIGEWRESRDSRLAAKLQAEEYVSVQPAGGQRDASQVTDSICSGRAAREMRLAAGYKMIGRVVTWWYATQEPGRQTLEGLADQVCPSDLHEGKG